MGLDLQTLQSQFTDVGKLVATSMDTFDRVKASLVPTATSPIAAAPSGSGVTPGSQTTQASPPSGLLAGNGLLIVGGLLVAIFVLPKLMKG